MPVIHQRNTSPNGITSVLSLCNVAQIGRQNYKQGSKLIASLIKPK